MGKQPPEDNRDDSAAVGRRGVSRRGFLKGAGILAGAAGLDMSGALRGIAHAAGSNPIVTENALPGTPGWDMDWVSDQIEGFTTEFSVNAGETVEFKIKTPSTSYRIDIYRTGWYGGVGARKVATVTPSATLPQTQPNPIRNDDLGLVDCGNWAVSATWAVPAAAVSGVYVANLIRLDVAGQSSRIIFVVRNDGRSTDLFVQTSDTTYQAYNRWGGHSLYYSEGDIAPYGRAVKVSYNRPMDPGQLENDFWYAEQPLVRWLERNGYDVSYTTCIDTDRRPQELSRHKVFVSSGHDEYWSGTMRANIEAARDAGLNLIFMTGNEVFWKTRWEDSTAGSNRSHRTLVCYKETLNGAKIDPSPEWTGTWRDPRFSPPSDGGRPENELTGTLFKAINPVDDPDFAITVPAEYSRLRFWRGTTIASLAPGTVATLSGATLGYEWNTDGDFPSRPPGLIRMSQTTETAHEVLEDFGKTYATKPLTHYMTMYRAPSGALVWSTGTVQWAWGLDSYHTNRPAADVPTDIRIQQATMNALADMGCQPATRQTGLLAATASTDHLPPVSTVTNPPAGATVPVGSPVVLTGTATDAGGGTVAGMEVSVDGGTTWHLVTGTSSWTYTFVPTAMGPITVKTRATDDSCNMETPGAGHTLVAGPRTLPGSLWNGAATPEVTSSDDTTPLELGMRFRTSVELFALGVSFYKGAGNTGTHTGRLWTGDGSLLATVTFSEETASGWQTATFDQPVNLTAGTTYVVSYSAPAGHYSYDAGYFQQAYEIAPLRGLANLEDGPNGVFSTALGQFPAQSYGASNYWVDVIVDTDNHRAPTAGDPIPARGLAAVALDDVVSIRFNEPMTPSSIVAELRNGNTVVPTTGAYDEETRRYTLTPSSPLAPLTTYTAIVTAARDLANEPMAAPYSWTFTTTGAPGQSPTSIWTTSATPNTPSVTDNNPIEIGVKFAATANGLVTGVRYYRGDRNTGTHLGRVWSDTGTLLATAVFTDESATGWQQVNFDTPVEITAGSTYIASCYCPAGGYPADGAFFGSSDIARGPIRALAGTTTGGNGVFRYGSGGGFPSTTYNRTNYWVDVMFEVPPDLSAPTVADRSPAAVLEGVHRTAPVTATFDKDVVPSSITFTLKASNGTTVACTRQYDAPTRTATLQPNAPLAAGTEYTASITATSVEGGTAMGEADTWTFTTITPSGATPATLWDTSVAPAVAAVSEPDPIEVGMKFRVDAAGAITGIRFYKGDGNTGTHVGHLWRGDGTLLGSVVFSTETRKGWQQANFATPIPVSPDTTYIASYHAPSGHYAFTSGGFAQTVNEPPIHGLGAGVDGGNGVFAYGSGSFPNQSYNSANYWVDVVFVDAQAPTVTGRFPASGAASVDPTISQITATFSKPVDPETISFQLRDDAGGLVAGTLSYDVPTRTAKLTLQGPLAAGRPYTASVGGARDLSGNAMSAPSVWSFTTASGSASTLFGSATPAVAATDDGSLVEVGMRFHATRAGNVTGVRFYKGTGNTGTHIGRLWGPDGSLLASVTFTGETASGWQTAHFSTPVAITAGAVYTVSYVAPAGHYAVNGGYFANGPVTNGPLVGEASGTTGNGVYRYGSADVMPTNAYNASNYWVDVLFV